MLHLLFRFRMSATCFSIVPNSFLRSQRDKSPTFHVLACAQSNHNFSRRSGEESLQWHNYVAFSLGRLEGPSCQSFVTMHLSSGSQDGRARMGRGVFGLFVDTRHRNFVSDNRTDGLIIVLLDTQYFHRSGAWLQDLSNKGPHALHLDT